MRRIGKTFNILSGISLVLVLLAILILSILPVSADTIVVPLGTVSETLQAGNYAEVAPDSSIYAISNPPAIGFNGSVRQSSVFRFQLNQAPGTRFENSKLIFTAAVHCVGAVDCLITFDNSDDSEMPTTWADYNGRSWLTSDVVEYVSAFPWIVGDQYATTDISPLLNDICARPGWVSGHYITFNIITYPQSPNPGTYDGSNPSDPIYSNMRLINDAVGTDTGAAILSYNPIMPVVETLDPLIHRTNTDNTVDYLQLQGQVDSFGAAQTLYCGFEWGLSSDTYQYFTPMQAVQRGKYPEFAYTITDSKYMPDIGTIYYRAVACLTYTGQTITGGNWDETINSYTSPIYIASTESTLNADPEPVLVTFPHSDISDLQTDLGCQLKSMGQETLLNSVTINYGTTPDCSDGTLIAATNVTHPNTWNSVRIDHLSANTIYYYRAHASGVAEYDGNIQHFQTFDPNKPMLVNKGNAWLNKIGIGVGAWWLIILALMLAIWLIPPIREEKLGRIIGCILDLVILGAGIALVLDPWVTVLIAIVGGLALTGIVLKTRGN